MSIFGFGVAYFRAKNVTEEEARRAALWATVIMLGWVAIVYGITILTPHQLFPEPPEGLVTLYIILGLPMLPGILASWGFDAAAHALGFNKGGAAIYVTGTAILLGVNWYCYFRLFANRIHIRAEAGRQIQAGSTPPTNSRV